MHSAQAPSEVRSGHGSQPAGETDGETDTWTNTRQYEKNAVIQLGKQREGARPLHLAPLGTRPTGSEVRGSHREGSLEICAFPSLATSHNMN